MRKWQEVAGNRLPRTRERKFYGRSVWKPQKGRARIRLDGLANTGQPQARSNSRHMNAYFYTAGVSRLDQGRIVDSCLSLILYGADAELTLKDFETRVMKSGDPSDPDSIKIERIIGAPILDRILSETGEEAIDWQRIGEDQLRIFEATEPGSLEQGYWVDCNALLPAGHPPSSLEALRAGLPEDVREGLNWSAEKTFYFLLSVISPPAPPPDPFEIRRDAEAGTGERGTGERSDPDVEEELDGEPVTVPFPELADKDLAVIVRARNAVVAGWLWRKYSASLPLASNAIQMEALCDFAPVGGGEVSI